MAKMIRVGAVALVIAALIGMAGVAFAQEARPASNGASAAAQERAAKPALVPLKLQIVLSRYQGEKKISSVPYLMWVTANEPEPTRLRMGVQVPIPTTTFGSNNAPISSYNMKDVGTNIDCRAATPGEPGMYRVSLTVNDSGVSTVDKQVGPGAEKMTLPSFRNFTSTFTILLRDGQTGQYTAATDPISGEVLKIDATLNVLK